MKERKAFLARVAIILAILILSSCSGKNIVGPDHETSFVGFGIAPEDIHPEPPIPDIGWIIPPDDVENGVVQNF